MIDGKERSTLKLVVNNENIKNTWYQDYYCCPSDSNALFEEVTWKNEKGGGGIIVCCPESVGVGETLRLLFCVAEIVLFPFIVVVVIVPESFERASAASRDDVSSLDSFFLLD